MRGLNVTVKAANDVEQVAQSRGGGPSRDQYRSLHRPRAYNSDVV